MQKKNDGSDFEIQVYNEICNSVEFGKFFIMSPNMKIFHRKGYYSLDRKKDIITDISIEIYVDNPLENDAIKPSIIVAIECKDYTHSLSVDDVEEFHAKLQQIGADNTKGIIITRKELYQESAVNYAKSKGIMLRSFEKPQTYVCYDVFPDITKEMKKCETAYIKYYDTKYELQKVVTYIGRDINNDIVIKDKFTSRHHCLIKKAKENQYVIQDCDSLNGTFVNYQRIKNDTILHDCDMIHLGNVLIIFREADV